MGDDGLSSWVMPDLPLHITSGDCAGGLLVDSGVPGEVFVWHDVLYDGPRAAGWPTAEILEARARFLETFTGGGLSAGFVLKTLEEQYAKLRTVGEYSECVLWFDACLFDQSMLAHILTCLDILEIRDVLLLCVDSFPGVDPYDGLGQLTPAQLSSVYHRRAAVSEEQFDFARQVDWAFAVQDEVVFRDLAGMGAAPLPWVPAAVRRWLREQPDSESGLGRLEELTLDALAGGRQRAPQVLEYARRHDEHPLYWGDTTLWRVINGLADRNPPLVSIQGPEARLPQWEPADIGAFVIERAGVVGQSTQSQ